MPIESLEDMLTKSASLFSLPPDLPWNSAEFSLVPDEEKFVKRYRLKQEAANKLLEREVKAFRALEENHTEHAVRLLDVDPPYTIVLELIRGATLSEVLYGARFTVNTELFIGTMLADLAAEIHDAGIVWKDMKPKNVLVDPSAKALRSIDFNASVPNNYRVDGFFGTAKYGSPESYIPGTCITTKSDVFSLGVMLYELFANAHPFSTQRVGIPDAIQHHEPTYTFEASRTVGIRPPGVEELLRSCLKKSPDERPAAAEVATYLHSLRSDS